MPVFVWFLIVLSLLFNAPTASAKTVNADFEDVFPIEDSAEILFAEEAALLSDVLQDSAWQRYQAFVKINPQNTLWIRFQVSNPSSISKLLTLVAGNTFIDHAEAYVLDEQGRIVQSSRISDEVKTTANLSRKGFKMDFAVRGESEFDVYILVRDDGYSLIPIELWQNQSYLEQTNKRLIMLGAMSGGLALLSIYFLLTYILRSTPARFWFCIFAIAAMTTMLSAEGVIPMLFSMPNYAAELTSLSLIVTLFSALKITRIVFSPLSPIWLYSHYALLLVPVVGIFVLEDFFQIILLLGLSGLFFVSKLVATLFYRKSIDLRSAAIYFVGWLCMTVVGVLELLNFAGSSQLQLSVPYPFAFSCLGVMLIGVAIISREQSIQLRLSAKQLAEVNGLKRYNDLFKHAAEGLFIARLNGDLVHVNPAICSLFGYENSEDCLSKIKNLSGLFAKEKDFDLMLGELSIQQIVLGKEVKGKRSDNTEFWFSISSQVKTLEKEALQFGSLFDITERRLHQINLQYLNTHDQLTGLYNRRHFLHLLNERIEADIQNHKKLALVFLDIDQFKAINDTCGHNAGDIFIKEMSLEFYDVVTDTNPFARLSADQFGILINYETGNQLKQFAEELLSKARNFEFKWDRHIFNKSVSIGIAAHSQAIESAEEFLNCANSACQIAKESGRDKIHIYSPELGLHDNYKREMFWTNEVENAIKTNGFELFYQHYRPLNETSELEYFELLVRLRTRDNDLVAPEFFMPSAEKTHISHKIDKLVIVQFFSWLSEHTEYIPRIGKANINLSSFALSDEDFKYFLFNAFEKYQIPFDKICFEITETTAILKMKDAISFIKDFKRLGCSFALDDFGAGFSSYSYLKSLPVDYLKIDGNFIRDLLKDKIDLAMVTSICDVAEAMKIKTVAEFVESQEIMVQVGKLGVNFAQGFFIAKPEPLVHFSGYNETVSQNKAE